MKIPSRLVTSAALSRRIRKSDISISGLSNRPLTADEKSAHAQTGEDRQGGHWVEPALRRLLEPIDHGEDGNQRHGGRDQVEFTSVGVAVLGEDPRPEDEEKRHHRQGEEENRAPPEPLQQETSGDRADGAAG